MSIVGFNFTKINAEREMGAKGQININNNISINNIEKTNIGLTGGKSAVKITFKFMTIYNPKIGKIELEGSIIVMFEDKKTEAILTQWKKNKSLPQDTAAGILNYMLEKCNIQSLIMAKEIGLPSPIRLPRINNSNAPEKKEDKSSKKATKKKTDKKTSKKKK